MRIVSWNIHGSPEEGTNREQERAWHHLAALDADLVLLQEVRESATPPWVHDEWDLCTGKVGTLGKTTPWGSVIAAKRALNLRERPDLVTNDPWLGIVYDYVITAEIDIDDTTPCFVASVHAPAVTAAQMLRDLDQADAIDDETLAEHAIEPEAPWSTDVIFHALERARSPRFVIGGDWNTARLFDRNRIVPASALFFSRTVAHGWVEALGQQHETPGGTSTGPGPGAGPGGGPFQVDHVFCDEETDDTITEAAVWFDRSALELGLHAPLVIDMHR